MRVFQSNERTDEARDRFLRFMLFQSRYLPVVFAESRPSCGVKCLKDTVKYEGRIDYDKCPKAGVYYRGLQ